MHITNEMHLMVTGTDVFDLGSSLFINWMGRVVAEGRNSCPSVVIKK
jgi:hypothetical protein